MSISSAVCPAVDYGTVRCYRPALFTKTCATVTQIQGSTLRLYELVVGGKTEEHLVALSKNSHVCEASVECKHAAAVTEEDHSGATRSIIPIRETMHNAFLYNSRSGYPDFVKYPRQPTRNISTFRWLSDEWCGLLMARTNDAESVRSHNTRPKTRAHSTRAHTLHSDICTHNSQASFLPLTQLHSTGRHLLAPALAEVAQRNGAVMKVCAQDRQTPVCGRTTWQARTDACVRDKTMSKVDCCVSRVAEPSGRTCVVYTIFGGRRTDNPNPWATAVDRLQLQQRWGAHENRLIRACSTT